MLMQVYLVRHGLSLGNQDGFHQNSQTELTNEGKKQAQQLAERLSNVEFELIIASDYERTVNTARIIAERTGHGVESTTLIREIKNPTEIEGKLYADPEAEQIRQQILEHQTEQDWHYSDEENFFDVEKRVKKFVRQLEQRSEKSLVCVAHGNIIPFVVMTMLLADLYTLKIHSALRKKLTMENTGLTLCEFKNGSWMLRTWNDYAHLGG